MQWCTNTLTAPVQVGGGTTVVVVYLWTEDTIVSSNYLPVGTFAIGAISQHTCPTTPASCASRFHTLSGDLQERGVSQVTSKTTLHTQHILLQSYLINTHIIISFTAAYIGSHCLLAAPSIGACDLLDRICPPSSCSAILGIEPLAPPDTSRRTWHAKQYP